MFILNIIVFIELLFGVCSVAIAQNAGFTSQNSTINNDVNIKNKYLNYRNTRRTVQNKSTQNVNNLQNNNFQQNDSLQKSRLSQSIQSPDNSNYQNFVNQKPVYESQGYQQQGAVSRFNENKQVQSALMPQQDIAQFQNYQQKPSFTDRSRVVIKNIMDGFNFNVYTQIGGGSGKYDYTLEKGWNVVSISPDLVGSYDTNFSTSSNLSNTYQNISSNEALNSKLIFGNVGIFAKFELPSLIGQNDLKVLKPFVSVDLNYSNTKPLQIKATKEVGYTDTSFQYVTVDYKYEGLKYTNMISLGSYLFSGFYASYGKDIYTKKQRIEAGYDFGGVIFFLSQEKLDVNVKESLKPSDANYQPLTRIQYTSIMGGLRFKIL